MHVRGSRIQLAFRAKSGIQVRTELVDEELAAAIRGLLAVRPGARVFKYRWEGDLYNLTSKRLNDYVKLYLGEEFSAKDFRTWGGTLLAAIDFAERGATQTPIRKQVVAAVMRQVAKSSEIRLPSAALRTSRRRWSSSISTGRTIEDFRPRHLRVVERAISTLSPEEAATLSLLRSWRIRQARKAA